jgi:hypothetical protein
VILAAAIYMTVEGCAKVAWAVFGDDTNITKVARLIAASLNAGVAWVLWGCL